MCLIYKYTLNNIYSYYLFLLHILISVHYSSLLLNILCELQKDLFCYFLLICFLNL
ncbi:hypothetical protein GS8_3355 [Geobacillus stearothermophilus]|uniref:Uncharacterized protein n=1 Tax=Geobacillus stearothermophilus TaxID=1422 RepID=A0ABQ7HAS9_GEOSE|nr:hypothetical protein GS8_3355 [Geobacillus stearothermophilus]